MFQDGWKILIKYIKLCFGFEYVSVVVKIIQWQPLASLF